MARGGHGHPKVSPCPTNLRLAGDLRPATIPLDTPRHTPMILNEGRKKLGRKQERTGHGALGSLVRYRQVLPQPLGGRTLCGLMAARGLAGHKANVFGHPLDTP
jgi:hypothetical protein